MQSWKKYKNESSDEKRIELEQVMKKYSVTEEEQKEKLTQYLCWHNHVSRSCQTIKHKQRWKKSNELA